MDASSFWWKEANRFPWSGRARSALSWFFLCALPCFAQDTELTANLGIEAEYTDNVNLSKDKESDLPIEIYTGFEYRDRSSAVEGVLDGRVGYKKYTEGNAADQLRPNVHGNLLFHLQPDRFSWALDGDWQQVRTNRLGPDSPGNLGTRAVFWTGPDVRLPLSAVTEISAQARAGYSDNSDSSNSHRFGGQLAVATRRTESSMASANLAQRAVRYSDTSTLADFDVTETFLRYASRTNRGNLALEVGTSFVDVKDGADGSDLLLRFDGSRSITKLGNIGLRLRYGFDDEENTALTRPLLPSEATPTDARSLGVFYRKEVEAYYDWSGKRLSFGWAIYVRNRDFATGARDETDYGTTVAWSTRLSRLSEAQLLAGVDFSDFEAEAANYHVYNLGIDYGRRLSRNVSAKAGFRHQRKISNEKALEYDASWLFFSIVYDFKL